MSRIPYRNQSPYRTVKRISYRHLFVPNRQPNSVLQQRFTELLTELLTEFLTEPLTVCRSATMVYSRISQRTVNRIPFRSLFPCQSLDRIMYRQRPLHKYLFHMCYGPQLNLFFSYSLWEAVTTAGPAPAPVTPHLHHQRAVPAAASPRSVRSPPASPPLRSSAAPRSVFAAASPPASPLLRSSAASSGRRQLDAGTTNVHAALPGAARKRSVASRRVMTAKTAKYECA